MAVFAGHQPADIFRKSIFRIACNRFRPELRLATTPFNQLLAVTERIVQINIAVALEIECS
jgi:hypothetical protein